MPGASSRALGRRRSERVASTTIADAGDAALDCAALIATTCVAALEGEHAAAARVEQAEPSPVARGAARSARGRASAASPDRRAGRRRCAAAGSTSGSHGSPRREAAARRRVPLHRVAERVAAGAVVGRVGPGPVGASRSRRPGRRTPRPAASAAAVGARRARSSRAEAVGQAREVVVGEHPRRRRRRRQRRARSRRADRAAAPTARENSSNANAASRCSR